MSLSGVKIAIKPLPGHFNVIGAIRSVAPALLRKEDGEEADGDDAGAAVPYQEGKLQEPEQEPTQSGEEVLQAAQLDPTVETAGQGLEFVLMAESETECDTPGLDTLGSECVIPHSQVTDVHYASGSEIMALDEKRDTDLDIHGADLKVQGLGAPELGSVTCVETDQIITETDHDYTKAEQQSDLQCFGGADMDISELT
ncbi:hypothetical protein AGOR_G00113940 [Albula goreensis]|uniref:Uncharacterized protein n=1 Tax=Albula goreensis TaxID=1534307 RepID=A0A8T3DDD8_9TELE|nr:hypothetical protein AGOR_G00113940 [Albula goreensis]